MHNPEQIHQITRLLAICWDENRGMSFGEMIDTIFSYAKGNTQAEFWNMEADDCLAAIEDFRAKMKIEREKKLTE